MSEPVEFVPGMIVKPPHERAPDFVKAQISIKVEELGAWLREKYKAKEEWVNLDVKVGKSGKWYASVSTFKPKPKQEPQEQKEKPRATDGMDDDIPF